MLIPATTARVHNIMVLGSFAFDIAINIINKIITLNVIDIENSGCFIFIH
jgi:hypothetical protein